MTREEDHTDLNQTALIQAMYEALEQAPDPENEGCLSLYKYWFENFRNAVIAKADGTKGDRP
jgi:hypothetical protein